MSNTPGLASNSTAIGNRATMWRNYKEQNSGFLYWVVNGFASVYPLRPRPELPEGDGILIYPGESFGTNKICTSVRLERWRDGAEDYDMLVLYEKNSDDRPPYLFSTTFIRVPRTTQIKANTHWLYVKI